MVNKILFLKYQQNVSGTQINFTYEEMITTST